MPPKDRSRGYGHSSSSMKAPAKKSGGGGKFTMGRPGDEWGAGDEWDPNFNEKRIDPDDGLAYTFDELMDYYRGKFKKAALTEYWEYECTPVKKTGSKKKQKEDGASTPKAKAKVKVKAKAKAKEQSNRLSDADMESDGPLAKECAAKIPYFPFKGIDRFYDIQGLLMFPKLFNAMCAVMFKRYRKMGATKIAGFDARGFLYVPVALKLNLPFIMLRKAGKMPNTISSSTYSTEYDAGKAICVSKGKIEKDDKVVLLDDLIATGGTLCAGIEVIKGLGAEVIECGCMVELKALQGRDKCLKAGAKSVWGFISEELLTVKAELDADYKDDGAPH